MSRKPTPVNQATLELLGELQEASRVQADRLDSDVQMISPVLTGLRGLSTIKPLMKRPATTPPIPSLLPIADSRGERKQGMVYINIKGQPLIPMGSVNDMCSRFSLNGFRTYSNGDDLIIDVANANEAVAVTDAINQAVWHTSDTS